MKEKRIQAYKDSKVARMSERERLERRSDFIEAIQFEGSHNRDWHLVEILKLASGSAEEFATTATGLGFPTKEEN